MGNRTHKRGEQQMSSVADVERARDYVRRIGGPGKGVAIIDAAYRLLDDLFPHERSPKDQWTLRRVRSFWERDAAHVKFREMLELHHAAAHVVEEKIRLQHARKEHAAFIKETTSVRSLIEFEDEAFLGDALADRRGLAGRMDRPGIEG